MPSGLLSRLIFFLKTNAYDVLSYSIDPPPTNKDLCTVYNILTIAVFYSLNFFCVFFSSLFGGIGDDEAAIPGAVLQAHPGPAGIDRTL